jgi:GMP synthase PP-ATPase subunit
MYCIKQEEFIGKEITRIREICGPKGRVIGAVSGGVDSTVAAKLMHEAIGDRFVFINVAIAFTHRLFHAASMQSWSIMAFFV